MYCIVERSFIQDIKKLLFSKIVDQVKLIKKLTLDGGVKFDIAKAIGVSPHTFSDNMKVVTGRTWQQYRVATLRPAVINSFKKGLTVWKLSKKYHLTDPTVRLFLKKAGLDYHATSRKKRRKS